MSGATYRIEITHDALWKSNPWRADVIRLSDDAIVAVKIGTTREAVAREARGAVVLLAAAPSFDYVSVTLYVDDAGQDVTP